VYRERTVFPGLIYYIMKPYRKVGFSRENVLVSPPVQSNDCRNGHDGVTWVRYKPGQTAEWTTKYGLNYGLDLLMFP